MSGPDTRMLMEFEVLVIVAEGVSRSSKHSTFKTMPPRLAVFFSCLRFCGAEMMFEIVFNQLRIMVCPSLNFELVCLHRRFEDTGAPVLTRDCRHPHGHFSFAGRFDFKFLDRG